MGRARRLRTRWMTAEVTMRPGYKVPPVTLPRGYQVLSSNQFKNELKLLDTRYLVALKLNQGSNSWIMLSNRITEKSLDEMAAPAMVMKIIPFSSNLMFSTVPALIWSELDMMVMKEVLKKTKKRVKSRKWDRLDNKVSLRWSPESQLSKISNADASSDSDSLKAFVEFLRDWGTNQELTGDRAKGSIRWKRIKKTNVA